MPDPQSARTTDTAELEVTPPGAKSEPASGIDFEELPGRPLRKRFGPLTYLLLGLIVACGAFYGGARYGNSQGTSGSTGGLAALASRLGASTGGKLSTGASSPTGGSFPSRSSKTTSSAPSGTGSRAFSFLGGGVSGTIKLITGKDFYVEESTGTVVKVDTTTGTAITVSSAASVTQLHPGDSVTVLGTNKSGTVSATRVTDSGGSTATRAK